MDALPEIDLGKSIEEFGQLALEVKRQRDELAAALRIFMDNENVFHLVVNGHLLDEATCENLTKLLVKDLPAMYDAGCAALRSPSWITESAKGNAE